MGGVCDDGADFAIAGNREAFAGHGDQFLLDADAIVSTHLVGTLAKETRECEIGERDQVRDIFGSS